MIARIALVCSIVACFAAQASAQAYAGLQVGPSFFSDADLSGFPGDVEYDPGFNVGGVAGARVFDVARAELGISYRKADVDEIGAFNVSGDVGVLGIMANAYYDFDLDLLVTPYVGAGIGLGVIFADFGSLDDEDAEFAYNFMGGLGFALTEQLVLDAGYRYFATTDADIETSDLEVGVHELVFGLRYEF